MKRDRLPPGQNLRGDFPVLHWGDIPEFDENTWDFTVTGLVKNPIEIIRGGSKDVIKNPN